MFSLPSEFLQYLDVFWQIFYSIKNTGKDDEGGKDVKSSWKTI